MTQSWFRRMGLAWRLALLVILGTGAIMGALVGYSVTHARRMLENEIQQKALYLAQATANRIETVEYSVEKVTEGLALALEDGAPNTRAGLYRALERLLSTNPEVFGASVAFAPPQGRGDRPLAAPYVYRDQGRLLRKDLREAGSIYASWDWYTLAQDRREPVWTDAYQDDGGSNRLMITYAVPFYGITGKFLGVVTCDVSLDWLTDYLAGLSLGRTGHAMLLARDGTFLAHPKRDWIMRESLAGLGVKREDPSLGQLAERMRNGASGILPINNFVDGNASWLAYAPIPSPEWTLGVMFSQDEAKAELAQVTREGLLIGLGGFSLLLLVVLAIARSITLPLRQLDKAVRALSVSVASDDGTSTRTREGLAARTLSFTELGGEDEVGRLAVSFARMQADLEGYLAKLAAATAARERIESELRVAQEIQQSLIPGEMSGEGRFEVRGLLEPAREVGGDFYDYFMADPDHLCLAIGDVSGKGVPAALFMAVTRTFLKASFQGGSPAVALSRLNDALAAENDSMMFVSLFCAVIHLPSGECRYANGGHPLPVLLRSGETEFLTKVRGALVGVMPGTVFEEGGFMLQRGDRLFLYTDGVTEALDAENALFGEERMRDVLRQESEQSCAELLQRMRASVKAHTGSAEQSDDLTMLAFGW
ncbi:Phosphoserine phosphatase RsbU [compost metagenome]